MENNKGRPCLFTPITCQESYCMGCQIFLKIWIRANMNVEIVRAVRETDVRETVPEEFINAFEGEGV